MIGWITLAEAEELASDIPNGSDWRTAGLDLLPTVGDFQTVAPPSRQVVGPAALDIDRCLMFDDLPFIINDITLTPQYTVSRSSEFPTPAVLTDYYDLGAGDAGAANCADFTDKRAYLMSAYNKLVALPGYSLTLQTPTSDALKRAQLICANTARGSSGTIDFYSQLLALGVKRERRGKAETEFFSPDERNQSSNLTGKAGEVLDLLDAAGHKEARTFGQQLSPDPRTRQKLGGFYE